MRQNLTNPPDWWPAFAAEAKRRKMSLSEFAGFAMMRLLPKDVRDGLSERKSVGAPKREERE